jgi:hypothetical protein
MKKRLDPILYFGVLRLIFLAIFSYSMTWLGDWQNAERQVSDDALPDPLLLDQHISCLDLTLPSPLLGTFQVLCSFADGLYSRLVCDSSLLLVARHRAGTHFARSTIYCVQFLHSPPCVDLASVIQPPVARWDKGHTNTNGRLSQASSARD